MDKITKNLQFCGIYMITNYVNNKRYIGSSVNVRQRIWSHRSHLRHNTHCNQHFQNAWNKYGEDNFNYSILEKCSEEQRFEREQYYVDALKPEYNICCDVVYLPPTGKDSREKQSKTRKELMAKGVISITNNKPVYVYYKDGTFKGKWESIRKAAKAIGVHYSSACKCIQGLDFQNKGYRFFLEEQSDIKPFGKPSLKGRKPTNLKWYIVDDGSTKTKILGRNALAEFLGTDRNTIGQYINSTHKWKRKYMIYLSSAVS